MYQPLNHQELSDAMAQRQAPKNAITAADITARIADVYHEKVYDSSGALRMTRCTIELDNGFQATGESVVVDPLNYIETLGKHYSYQDAFSKLWPFFGFLARERKFTKVIELTPAEAQSGYDRVKWAEGLINQLPEDHEGRNSWLMNFGQKEVQA